MILYDQNPSKRLPFHLGDLFPGAKHVVELGLEKSPDAMIWSKAAELGLAIVTKDTDYVNLSVLNGAPPKVVWIATGNSAAGFVRNLLRSRAAQIITFLADDTASLQTLDDEW